MTDPRALPARSILVVDDDETFRTVLARALRTRGYEVTAAGNYEEAVGRTDGSMPDYALVDLHMPGRSGFDLVSTLKRIHPPTIVIVLTADRSPESRAAAMRGGASGYLTKPTDADEVIAALRAGSQDRR